jgi:hypothetical protein
MFCGENHDMVADPSVDQKKWKNSSTIVFTCTPVEVLAEVAVTFVRKRIL